MMKKERLKVVEQIENLVCDELLDHLFELVEKLLKGKEREEGREKLENAKPKIEKKGRRWRTRVRVLAQIDES